MTCQDNARVPAAHPQSSGWPRFSQTGAFKPKNKCTIWLARCSVPNLLWGHLLHSGVHAPRIASHQATSCKDPPPLSGPHSFPLPAEATPPRLLQASQLSEQAETLTARSGELQAAAARVSAAVEALSTEQTALARALESFCSGVDEESVCIGCPLLRRFVPLFEELRDEQVKLSAQIRALLVTALDTGLAEPLQQIKVQQKAVSRLGGGEPSRGRLRMSLSGRPSDVGSSDVHAQAARLEYAAQLTAWQSTKERVFLDSFVQLAHGLRHFFERGGAAMAGMETFVDDMQHASDAAASRGVHPPPCPACRASCSCRAAGACMEGTTSVPPVVCRPHHRCGSGQGVISARNAGAIDGGLPCELGSSGSRIRARVMQVERDEALQKAVVAYQQEAAGRRPLTRSSDTSAATCRPPSASAPAGATSPSPVVLSREPSASPLPAGPLQMTNQQVELAQEIGTFMKVSRAKSEQVRACPAGTIYMPWRAAAVASVPCRCSSARAPRWQQTCLGACPHRCAAATSKLEEGACRKPHSRVQIWVLKQGWLSKRASGRMKGGAWQRRWFVLQSDGALYHLSSRNGEDRKPVVNLRIATIKGAAKEKEPLTFSLVSPALTYYLQAESDAERQGWIDCIQVRSSLAPSMYLDPGAP